MTIQPDSIVLVIIDRLNKNSHPYGIRTLVNRCCLADKTISKAIKRLEGAGKLRVFRGEPGTRHEYVVLQPPDEIDQLAASIHLGERMKV